MDLKKYYQKALDMYTTVLGPDHPITLETEKQIEMLKQMTEQ